MTLKKLTIDDVTYNSVVEAGMLVARYTKRMHPDELRWTENGEPRVQRSYALSGFDFSKVPDDATFFKRIETLFFRFDRYIAANEILQSSGPESSLKAWQRGVVSECARELRKKVIMNNKERCGKCSNCAVVESARQAVLRCVNPPFTHADDDVVNMWNEALRDYPCEAAVDDEEAAKPDDDEPTVYTQYGRDGVVRMSLHPFNAPFGYSRAPSGFRFKHRVIVRAPYTSHYHPSFSPSCYCENHSTQFGELSPGREEKLAWKHAPLGTAEEKEAAEYVEAGALNWLLEGEENDA